MAEEGASQSIEMLMNERGTYNGEKILLSGLVGLFTGTGGKILGNEASKFMDKVKDKKFEDLTKKELKKYRKYQEKYLKQQLEVETGAKVGKRQLDKALDIKVEEWKDIRVSEINALDVIVTESSEKSGEAVIHIIGTETVTEDE